MPNTPTDDFNLIMRQIVGAARETYSTAQLSVVGKFATETIKKRTRLGFGTQSEDPGGTRERLQKLSDSYKDFRKGKVAFYTDDFGRLRKIPNPKKKPRLDSSTSPGKSNLTFTGKMLRSITWRVRGQIINIFARGQKNKDKVFFAHSGSRNRPKRIFLSLTSKEVLQVTNFIDKLFSFNLTKRKLF
jgi:hypothetical protein